MKKYLSILFLIALGTIQSQTTWYISTSGLDSNSGLTSIDAFATVNRAINFAACGDSIYILGGTYEEKINAYLICPKNNRVTIQGDVSNRPLIIGDNNATNKYAIGVVGEGFVFRHLELTSPQANNCDPSNMVIVGSGDYFDFIDIIVHHAGYDGIKTTSDCTNNNFAIGWRIINSEVYDNGLACPASILNGDGIDFTNCRNCLIENTIVKDNKGHQVQVKLEARNVTIQNCHIEGVYIFQIGLLGNTPQCDPNTYNADSVFIRNNTILAKGDTSEFLFKIADVRNLYIENNTIVKDNVMLDVGFICFGGCGSSINWQNPPTAPVVVRNNIFYSRASMPFFAGPDTTFYDPLGIFASTVSASYNLFYDINGDYITPPDNSSTSFIADPKFCEYPNSFELGDNSPCINNGDPASPNDPDLSRNDIGARYYQNACAVSITNRANILSFNLYPNPSSNKVTLSLDKEFIGCNLNVYNEIGQLMLNTRIINQEQTLNMETFHPGVYYIKVSDVASKQYKFMKLFKN